MFQWKEIIIKAHERRKDDWNCRENDRTAVLDEEDPEIFDIVVDIVKKKYNQEDDDYEKVTNITSLVIKDITK